MGENKVFLNATIPEYQGDLCLFLKKKHKPYIRLVVRFNRRN